MADDNHAIEAEGDAADEPIAYEEAANAVPLKPRSYGHRRQTDEALASVTLDFNRREEDVTNDPAIKFRDAGGGYRALAVECLDQICLVRLAEGELIDLTHGLAVSFLFFADDGAVHAARSGGNGTTLRRASRTRNFTKFARS